MKKKFMSVLLIAAMIWSMAAMPLAAAPESEAEVPAEETQTEISETTQEQETVLPETETEVPEEVEAEAVPAEESAPVQETEEAKAALSFVYLQQNEITAPDQQVVAAALTDTSRNIVTANLTYAVSDIEQEQTVPAATIADGAFSFIIDHRNAVNPAVVTLRSITYTYTTPDCAEPAEAEIPMTEELAASYQVKTAEPETANEDGISVYTIDEAGNAVEADSIEDALSEAGADASSIASADADQSRVVAGVSRSRSALSTSNTAAGTAGNWNSNSPGLVVAIDPGHDSTHAGATANGLKEEEVNLKIALAMRDELETYEDVTVYMTHTTLACPYPGTTSSQDNTKRVQAAYNAGADVYIAIHLNSAGATAKGALVIAQNNSWKPQVAAESKEVSEKVLTELSKLGLVNRGVITKDATDGSTYPDGSIEDYYTIPNIAKECGIPALIVEHGFLTNASEAAFFKSDANIKQVGIADAAAVANQYGLVKGNGKIRASSVAVSFNELNGLVTMKADGVRPLSKVATVKFAIWKKAGSVTWLTAGTNGSGTWTKNYSLKTLNGFSDGQYFVDCYAYDSSGKATYLGGSNASVTNRNLTVSVIQSSPTTLTATAKLSSWPQDLKSLKIAVWSKKDMADLHWITLQGSGTTRSVSIPLSDYKTYGTYYIDTYADYTTGSQYGASNQCVVNKPSLTETIQNNNGTSYDVVLSNVKVPTGINRIRVAVWNQVSDLTWYTAEKQSDGTWKVHVSYTEHANRQGTYYNDVYVQDSLGVETCVSSVKTTIVTANPKASAAKVGGSACSYALKVTNADEPSGSKIVFAVWNQTSDLKWYTASKDGTGAWNQTIDLMSHGHYGKYYTDAYLQNAAGTRTYLCSTTFTFLPTANVSVSGAVQGAKSVTLSISNLSAPFGYQSLSIADWPKNGAVVWNTLPYAAGTSRTQVLDLTKLSVQSGQFYADVYLKDATGSYYVGGANFMIPDGTSGHLPLSVSASAVSGSASKKLLKATGITAPAGGSVVFAVWNQTSDLKWYTAQASAQETYTYTVDTVSHKQYGKYYVDCYKKNADGSMTYVNGTTFTIAKPSASVSTDAIVAGASKATVRVSNISAPFGYGSLRAAIWPQAGSANWTTIGKNSTGSYAVTVDTAKLGYTNGVYYCDIYLVDGNGISTCIGSQRMTLTASLYPIMGSSSVTVQQMVNCYIASSPIEYPAAALAPGGASTIYAFCRIIYDEAIAEGVRPEVVFAQAMLETGWLKFGGDVKISQYNFAGLGATGNGVPGNSFPNVRTGIRAQVQHLKAYASTAALVNPVVDTRFQYVTRGVAPYVEWLGTKENPTGAGWAVSAGYGSKIRAIIKQMLP